MIGKFFVKANIPNVTVGKFFVKTDMLFVMTGKFFVKTHIPYVRVGKSKPSTDIPKHNGINKIVSVEITLHFVYNFQHEAIGLKIGSIRNVYTIRKVHLCNSILLSNKLGVYE
jgi:hypothetical protein